MHAQTTPKLNNGFVRPQREVQLYRGGHGQEITGTSRRLRPQLGQIRRAAATRGKIGLQCMIVQTTGQALLGTCRTISERQRIQHRARCIVRRQGGFEFTVFCRAARALGDNLCGRLGQEATKGTTGARGTTRIQIATSTGGPQGRCKERRWPVAVCAPQPAPSGGNATGSTFPLFVVRV